MKKLLTVLTVMVVCSPILYAQNAGVKTNLAHWVTAGSPNLGMEFALGRKYSLEIGGGLNPWVFENNRKMKHWLVQPEARYWFCEVFNGHFLGLHALASEFNMGGMNVPIGRLSKLKDYRYEGFAYGAGLSYGYSWILSPRWNLEFNLGGGFAYILYDKFPCEECGEKIESGTRNYFGITKVTVSLIYFIK
jgi:hypothetical protein